jgi:DNA-binding CsgD family transcriptional regulator
MRLPFITQTGDASAILKLSANHFPRMRQLRRHECPAIVRLSMRVGAPMAIELMIDRIYEASVAPELWSAVLDQISSLAGGCGAALLTRRSDAWTGWRLTLPGAEHCNSYLQSEAATHSATTPRLIAMKRAGFVADHELFSERDYLADPFMANYATPAGLHHGAATAIEIPTGDLAVVQVMRRLGAPRFEATDLALLDRLRPHLARAALLAARWRLEKMRAATEALALIGLPAAVVNGNCSVLAANHLVENLTNHVVWLPANVIALKDNEASTMLKLSAGLAAVPIGDASRSFPASATADSETLIVHVCPLRGQRRELFDGGAALVVFTPLSSPNPPDAKLIQGLFDLTAAEARVATGIASGMSLEDIARQSGVSRETVRSQLRSVMEKTGTRRQAELAAKLSGASRLDTAG